MTTIDVLLKIAEQNKNISMFMLHSFPNQVLLQDRLIGWGMYENRHFEKAMCLRNKYHMPFWDSIMLSTFENKEFSSLILQAALLHNHASSFQLISPNKLSDFVEKESKNQRLAICSKVILDNNLNQHIPMFDFHIPVSPTNFNVVQCVCKLLGLEHGFILNSGESYHYIGSSLLEWDEMYMLLAKALLYSPIIDKAWISHQLQEKSCSLRIDRKHGVNTKLLFEY